MHIAVPYNTDRETARRRIDQRLDQLLAQYSQYLTGHDKRWEADTLYFNGSARGFKASGTLTLTDTEIVIDGKLPLIAKPFEPRIKNTIEREAAAIFG